MFTKQCKRVAHIVASFLMSPAAPFLSYLQTSMPMQLSTICKILNKLLPLTENNGVEGCELAFIATKCVYEADKEVSKIAVA